MRALELAKIMAQDQCRVSLSEWDDHEPENHPLRPGPEFYLAQIEDCHDGREALTLLADEGDDSGVFAEFLQDLEGHGLTWRVFDPGRWEDHLGAWRDAFIEAKGPGIVNHRCAATNNADPVLVIHDENYHSHMKLQCAAEAAFNVRHTVLPRIELID